MQYFLQQSEQCFQSIELGCLTFLSVGLTVQSQQLSITNVELPKRQELNFKEGVGVTIFPPCLVAAMALRLVRIRL